MKKSAFAFVLALFLMLGGLNLAAGLGPAMAQDKAPASGQEDVRNGLSGEQIDAEIARLNDEQVREQLLARLHQEARARAEAQADTPGLSQRARFAVRLIAENLRTMIAAVPKTGSELLRAMSVTTQGAGFLGLMASLGLMLASGFVAEWFFRRKSKPVRGKIPSPQGGGKLDKVLPALMHALLNTLNVLAFAAGAVLVLALAHQGDQHSWLFLTLILELLLAVRIVRVLSRMVLAPHHPELRLMELGTRTASQAHAWIMGIAAAGLSMRVLYELVDTTDGDPGVVLLMATIKESILGILVIAAIVYFKNNVAQAIRANAPDPEHPTMFRLVAADFWHFGAILYFVLVSGYWVVRLWVTGQPSQALSFASSLLIIPVYFLVDEMVQLLLRRMFDSPADPARAKDGQPPDGQSGAQSDAQPEAQSGAQSDAQSGAQSGAAPDEHGQGRESQDTIIPLAAVRQNLPVVRRVIRLVIVFVLGAFVLNTWGIRVPLGQTVTRAALEVFFTLLTAHLLWEFIKSYIQRKLREAPQEVDAGGSLHRSKTLLPLFRKTIGAFLFVVTILVVLASLGLNIWPMLAGAGIFGLAIGLGSQSLVKDVVAGIFFLMADTFRVGDYVSMDGNEGYVEKITVRTISVRHYLGALNVVPFGGIKSVTNYTRGPMTVKYKIPLPLGTDPKLVKKVVKEVNKTIEADPEMGPNLLEPLKSQGCKSVQDSVMQFGIKFTAKPGTQFRIKRESLDFIQKALAEKGILFASRAVKIDLDALADVVKPPAAKSSPQEPKHDAPETDGQQGADAKEQAQGESKNPEDAESSSPEDTESSSSKDAEPSGADAAEKGGKTLSPDQLLLAQAGAAAAIAFLDDDDQARAAKKK